MANHKNIWQNTGNLPDSEKPFTATTTAKGLV